jgi:hypothetical protein
LSMTAVFDSGNHVNSGAIFNVDIIK